MRQISIRGVRLPAAGIGCFLFGAVAVLMAQPPINPAVKGRSETEEKKVPPLKRSYGEIIGEKKGGGGLVGPWSPGSDQADWPRFGTRALVVGVRRLPERLTPLTAQTDPERLAVDLVFESLYKAVPHPELGRRYEPNLANGLPLTRSTGRAFTLRSGAPWLRDGTPLAEVELEEIQETYRLLQGETYRNTFVGQGLEAFGEFVVLPDGMIEARLKAGTTDTLALLTRKILPLRSLRERNLPPDGREFTSNPYGTGPFRYAGSERRFDRDWVVYKKNEEYGRRAEQAGRPNLDEIRFVVPGNVTDTQKEFTSGNMHVLLDAASRDVDLLLTPVPGKPKTTKHLLLRPTRRIIMLAINHRRVALRDPEMRRGLAYAIDREGILNEVYRGGLGLDKKVRHPEWHQALRGPFPVGSWAERPKATDLFRPAEGAALLGRALDAAQLNVDLTLRFPNIDPTVQLACEKIKESIEKILGDRSGKPALRIILKPQPLNEFERDLFATQDFDLAWFPYDYSDERFLLADLLDQRSTNRFGRNFLGYLTPESNPKTMDLEIGQALARSRVHRDPMVLRKIQQEQIHDKFVNFQMPFIPLFQLDYHVILRTDVRPVLGDFSTTRIDQLISAGQPIPYDPDMLFVRIERWARE